MVSDSKAKKTSGKWTEEDYLENRVDLQIEWYDKKSSRYKLLSILFHTIILFLTLLIPFLVELMEFLDPHLTKLAIFATAFTLAVLTGVLSKLSFGEKWQGYRETCEMLKHQKYLFLTKSGEYKDMDDSFTYFVSVIEHRVISKEHSNWTSMPKD